MVEYPKPGIKPLCGSQWLREHLRDYTHAEIEALTIEVNVDGRRLPAVSARDNHGKIKNKIKELR